MINNLGPTTMMELWIVNRKVHQILTQKGMRVHDAVIGSFCTCHEKAGFSITLLKLDEELKKYYDMPANSLGFRKARAMEKSQLDLESSRQMFLFVSQKMKTSKNLLTDLDKAVGDGDYGIGMARGFEAVQRELENRSFDSIGKLLHGIGHGGRGSLGAADGKSV